MLCVLHIKHIVCDVYVFYFTSIKFIVAPTVLINGLETAPVTATVGEDVTIVCTARGFPDITIDILVTGATGAQFIGTQTLVTEATPTTPQEVTRAVTISIMTALDCEAMVTCEANNMNSDGSPMRDEATATLRMCVLCVTVCHVNTCIFTLASY